MPVAMHLGERFGLGIAGQFGMSGVRQQVARHKRPCTRRYVASTRSILTAPIILSRAPPPPDR